jgi:hypothetical protein
MSTYDDFSSFVRRAGRWVDTMRSIEESNIRYIKDMEQSGRSDEEIEAEMAQQWLRRKQLEETMKLSLLGPERISLWRVFKAWFCNIFGKDKP